MMICWYHHASMVLPTLTHDCMVGTAGCRLVTQVSDAILRAQGSPGVPLCAENLAGYEMASLGLGPAMPSAAAPFSDGASVGGLSADLSRIVGNPRHQLVPQLPCPSAASPRGSSSASTAPTDVTPRRQFDKASYSPPASLLPNQFWCGKCRRQHELCDGRERGSFMVCYSCVNSYASLVGRWKNNGSLRTWWKNLYEIEQADWFRRQRDHGFGSKRKWDAMGHEEESSKMQKHNDMNNIAYIPWVVFLRRNLILGFYLVLVGCWSGPGMPSVRPR